MTNWQRLRRFLAGPFRRQRLAALLRRRAIRDLPGMVAAARRALAECEADITAARPGRERWRLKNERLDWERLIDRMEDFHSELVRGIR